MQTSKIVSYHLKSSIDYQQAVVALVLVQGLLLVLQTYQQMDFPIAVDHPLHLMVQLHQKLHQLDQIDLQYYQNLMVVMTRRDLLQLQLVMILLTVDRQFKFNISNATTNNYKKLKINLKKTLY